MTDINVDELYAQFEEEYEETDTDTDTETETETDTETSDETEDVESPDTETETEDVEETEETETETEEDSEEEPGFPEEKQNKAFADMRKQLKTMQSELDSKSKYADIIQRIAENNGTTPEKIVEEYERRQLEQQAQNQNVPVEFLQKQQQMQKELESLRNQSVGDKLRQEANELKKEYELTDDQVKEVVSYLDEHKFPMSVSLKDGYFLMNKDEIVKNQVKEENQRRLQEKQQKRKNAALPQGGNSEPQSRSDALSDDEFNNILDSLDLQI